MPPNCKKYFLSRPRGLRVVIRARQAGGALGPSESSPLPIPVALGVSKVVTVDVKGNWPRWLKVRDLTKGVTYFFRVQARTIAYGPELQANVTAGPAEGE